MYMDISSILDTLFIYVGKKTTKVGENWQTTVHAKINKVYQQLAKTWPMISKQREGAC